jgi:hypothetical protein
MIIFKINNEVIPEVEYIVDLKYSLNNKKSKFYRKNKIWNNADLYIEFVDNSKYPIYLERFFKNLPIRSCIFKNFFKNNDGFCINEIFENCKNLEFVKFLDENNNECFLLDQSFKNTKYYVPNSFISFVKNNLNLKYLKLSKNNLELKEKLLDIIDL